MLDTLGVGHLPRRRIDVGGFDVSSCSLASFAKRSFRCYIELDEHVRANTRPILQTAFGFWNSKVLLTAVEFGLFTTLGQRRLTGAEIGKELALHPRGIADFLDALVAMKFLEREGDGPGRNISTRPRPLSTLTAKARATSAESPRC